jgi:nitrile hydratase
MVLPERPSGTEGWTDAQLMELITRDSMIGTGFPKSPNVTR